MRRRERRIRRRERRRIRERRRRRRKRERRRGRICGSYRISIFLLAFYYCSTITLLSSR
jgi:hypothetical protein